MYVKPECREILVLSKKNLTLFCNISNILIALAYALLSSKFESLIR